MLHYMEACPAVRLIKKNSKRNLSRKNVKILKTRNAKKECHPQIAKFITEIYKGGKTVITRKKQRETTSQPRPFLKLGNDHLNAKVEDRKEKRKYGVQVHMNWISQLLNKEIPSIFQKHSEFKSQIIFFPLSFSPTPFCK